MKQGFHYLDKHGQPLNQAYNWNRNKHKATQTLLGICEGVTADRNLNADETLMLATWLQGRKHLENDPDVIDLKEQVADILEDGLVTQEELDDLLESLHTVLEFRGAETGPNLIDSDINRLLGIVQGVTADQHLPDVEILTLRDWLEEKYHLHDIWPASVIMQRIEQVLEDSVITELERLDLLDTLNTLIGSSFAETGATDTATRLPVESVESINPWGKSFCFTGKFVYGIRKNCERAILNLGGAALRNVSKDLDYLVIGALTSRDWALSTHGRKIQQAIDYKEKGHPVTIVAEEVWTGLLKLD